MTTTAISECSCLFVIRAGVYMCRLGRSQQLINDRWSDSEADSDSDNSPDTSQSPRSAAMGPANAQQLSRTRDTFGWRTLGSRPQDFGLRRDAAHRQYQVSAGHFHQGGSGSASEQRPANRINPYGLPLHPIHEADEYIDRRHPVERFGFRAGQWEKCFFCGMDPPDHPGRHCPMHPRRRPHSLL